MQENNLPVLVLKNTVLLPLNEVRMDFDTPLEKQIFSLSEGYYDSNILVINTDTNEEIIQASNLPNIGVVGKVKLHIDLPNGKTKVVVSGIKRVEIIDFVKGEQVLEAKVAEILSNSISEKEYEAYLRALYNKIEKYQEVTNLKDDILNNILKMDSLEELTDCLVPILPISNERKIEYVLEASAIKRVEMILSDINHDMEIAELERIIDDKLSYEIEKSQKEYVLREKIRVIKEELGDINDKDNEIQKLREQIENSKCNIKIKERLYLELNRYEAMTPSAPEVGMIRTYIDWLLDLPWNTYTKDNNDLNKVKEVLDKSHFGLEQVKERIVEYLAVKKNTNSLKSPIICLVGPPGVGKTTLAKSIADSLNRKWTKISVGGINDEAEIVGHRRTYVGAAPGLIIQGMKKAGSSNPVFIIDEIDKMTKDIKGDPSSCLLEVLDPEQNSTFYDNYIEEAFDLSKVMFILTANSLLDIPYALRDRLEIINLTSYTTFEKLDIVKNYMFSKLLKEHGLTKNNLIIDDETINFIIKHYTKEAGVRELERVLSSLMRKIAKEIITGSKRKKFVLNEEDVIRLLGNIKYVDIGTTINNPGVVNGLAYTDLGGSILPIEVSHYKGKGNVNMTGSLGNVMKESAQISIGYIKNNYKEFGVDIKKLNDDDIHINALHAGIPKDGPSAGITLVTAILSSFLNKKIDNKIGMTGEITLNGNILGIGGLREKSIAAYNSGIKKIFIPKENESDISEIPKEVLDSLEIVFVSNYSEIFNNLFN